MAGDQDPSKQPPEGTPAGEAGKDAEGKDLFFGKYKTKEEAEKAFKEGETKYHEGQQELADAKRELKIERQKTELIEGKQEEIRKAKTEEEKKRLEQDLKQMGEEFAAETKKGPAAMMRSLYRMIEAHPSVVSAVKREDFRRQSEADRRQKEVFNKVRAAHKEDFDILTPQMAKIWAGLPPQSKVPEMLETVYKMAKAEGKKIIADARAGHGEGGGEKPPPVGEKSDVDKVIEEHRKTKVF